jgi:hypothetical protein
MRRERAIRWLVRHIPEPILAAPERVLINFACLLIGLSAILAVPPGSLLATWPHWAALEWASAMMIGGGCALYGYWFGRRSAARLGYMLIGFAAFVYAVAVLLAFGRRGLGVVLIWLAIAAAKGIRLLVGSAVRNAIIQSDPDLRP